MQIPARRTKARQRTRQGTSASHQVAAASRLVQHGGARAQGESRQRPRKGTRGEAGQRSYRQPPSLVLLVSGDRGRGEGGGWFLILSQSRRMCVAFLSARTQQGPSGPANGAPTGPEAGPAAAQGSQAGKLQTLYE